VRRRILFALGLLMSLAVGVALGEALDEGAAPDRTQTLVRTLQPLPLAPAARETVTITVPNR
jgi:hypothetical protein